MADPHFIGILQMGPNPADPSGNTIVVVSKGFAFYDDEGDEWEAAEGEITDGASIPKLLKPLIGHSFNNLFMPAAVLHDLYCQKKTRTWQRTAEMFYEALVTNGVARPRALAMYAAVYAFGPKWPEPGAYR